MESRKTMTDYRIQGATGEWEVVIGLEVHAQVTSNAKLFSGASTAFGAEPNSQVSLVDAAMPGMLPVPNRECIRQAVRTGMAIEAQINKYSRFDRKNYFYPDLPKGYQISQYEHPLATDGELVYVADDGPHAVRIIRVHLEEDAGKSLHTAISDGDRHTQLDFNRSGVPLIEIVTHPDLRAPREAADFFARLRVILLAIGVNDGNMEEGSLRCDANVSVRPAGESALGVNHPGIVFRELHEPTGQARIDYGCYWRSDDTSPALRRFLGLIRERYPDA